MSSFFSALTGLTRSNNNNNSNSVGSNSIGSSASTSFNRPSLLTTNSFDSFHCFDKVRVAVVGDTTVGKTSLVNLICRNQVIDSPSWTLGCDTDIKIHEYHSKDYFIEFVDVGGSAKYKMARSLFYAGINGLIVVYDVTNKNSLSNVKKWIFEVLNKVSTASSNWSLKETENPKLLELENTVHQNNKAASIPLLILGNKSDLYHDTNYLQNDKLGRLSIAVSALKINCFKKESDNYNKLDLFFNKIISNMLAGSKRRSLAGISQGVFSFNVVTPNNSNSNSSNSNHGGGGTSSKRSDFGPQFQHQTQYQQQEQDYQQPSLSTSSTIERPLYLNHQNLQSLSPTLPLTIHDLTNDSNDSIFKSGNYSPPSTSLPMFLSTNSNNNHNNNNINNSSASLDITISPLPTRSPHRTRSTSFERKWNK